MANLITYDSFDAGFFYLPGMATKVELQEEMDVYINHIQTDIVKPFIGTDVYAELQENEADEYGKWFELKQILHDVIAGFAYCYYRRQNATETNENGESTPISQGLEFV